MAITEILEVVHMPTGDRPQYGSPYPEGIAVAHRSSVGDATAGLFSFNIFADPGFLYRLEFVSLQRGSSVVVKPFCTVSYDSFQERSGEPAGAWDVSFQMEGDNVVAVGIAFVTYILGTTFEGANPLPMMKRLWMGRTDKTVHQMMQIGLDNVDLITLDVNVAWTYWRKEALFKPGFLSSFHEAPAVPPLIRTPTGS